MVVKNEEGVPVGLMCQPVIMFEVAHIQQTTKREFKRLQAKMLREVVVQIATEIDSDLNELAFEYQIESKDDDLPRIIIPSGVLRP